MTDYHVPILSLAILDFKREREASQLFDSLVNLRVPVSIVYAHDGPAPQYVLDLFAAGKIDTLIQTRENQGCGIQTRQLFQACMSPYILYCQVDQILARPFGVPELQRCLEILKDPSVFYIDLAGNQGRGNPSERALLMERKRYLAIPDIDSIIGGPGPFAQYKWTERHLQDYMRDNNLKFITATPAIFADNGKWSRRAFDDGGETLHSTDEKVLIITKPLTRRHVSPHLERLTDEEWTEILEGHWPVEGKIPVNDLPHSFKAW